MRWTPPGRLYGIDAHWFTSLTHAREVIEAWRHDYNEVRPHSSIGDKTPSEFAAVFGHEAA